MKSFAITLSLFIFGMQGCGNPLEPEGQMLNLVVYGVYQSPESADGNQSPKFYKMTLQRVDLISLNGETVSFEPDDASKRLRIIDRPQIVMSKDISDYQDQSFTGANVVFGPEVSVGGKYQSDYSLTLSPNEASTPDAFTIGKTKGLRMTVKIKWLDTILRDDRARSEVITAPEYSVTAESE